MGTDSGLTLSLSLTATPLNSNWKFLQSEPPEHSGAIYPFVKHQTLFHAASDIIEFSQENYCLGIVE